ncbi:MAG TPA: hypothetical protein VNT81_09180 [Vicinamibacterales bacterium]|nr:hypothetical protein [Vicinamibacterales bacterium]
MAFSALRVLPLCLVLLIPGDAIDAREQGAKKPSLSLKATPSVAFAPARLTFLAEVKGGPEDYEEFYCPTVEWEWGDLTESVSEADCEPYEAGKSAIKRRYTVQRQFKNPGAFKVVIRLKKGSKVIASANTSITIRAGLGDPPR